MKARLAFLAGFSALAPLLGVQVEAAASAEAPTKFSPPSAPLVLSRTVFRELPDGKQIVVKRSFRVQFVASDGGFMVTGSPIAVSVDVPPVLARMGELERRRAEPGPFPMMIDSQGAIHAPGPGGPDRQTRESARQTANGLILGTDFPDQTKQDAIQALGAMAADSRGSPWPVDLFNAKDAERHQHRTVSLADGSQGEVSVLLRVGKWLPCGLPALFERIITTDLGGTRRVSREVWSLELVGGV